MRGFELKHGQQKCEAVLRPDMRQEKYSERFHDFGKTGNALKSSGAIAGYASLFNEVDLGGDMVTRGAFIDSITKRGTRGIRMLFQHDPAEPIGVWDVVREDARGLYVRGRLNMGVERAREVWALLCQGAVEGLSIGFKADRARREPRSGIRRLERVDLWEVSIVTFPMLPKARAAALKSSPLPRRR